MKKLIVQSAVMSRFSNKQTVMAGTISGAEDLRSPILGEIRKLISSLFKVESVHVYVMSAGHEIVIGREDGTLMVGVPLGLTKDKIIAQVSEYLLDNKRSLVFRLIRFLGNLLKITKLSKYADAIVGVVEVVVDLFVFKERQTVSSGMGFRNHVPRPAMDAGANANLVHDSAINTVGKFSSPINVADYDKPLSSVHRLQTFKIDNYVH